MTDHPERVNDAGALFYFLRSRERKLYENPGDGSAVPASRGKDQGEKAPARRRL
jgi:hypothetical protein